MPIVEANGIEIAYESLGPEDSETILLIMGLGAQLTQWPQPLCDELVRRGYHVLRFDNRDAGLSTKFERGKFPRLPEAFADLAGGKPPFVPYTLFDMADDAIGLLDALGIGRAHIVGASMGGMIAQLIASEYPERTLSLTSIMSSSGNAMLPPPKPRALGLFFSPAPPVSHREAVIQRGIKTYQAIGSPAYPTDEAVLRKWVVRDMERAYYPAGVMRQMAAVMTNGDRRPRLRRIDVPTVVLHGDADPLVPVEAGRDTAANIEGAELRIVEGMGHDIPLQLIDTFADAIVASAERATGVKARKSSPVVRIAGEIAETIERDVAIVAEAVEEVVASLPVLIEAAPTPSSATATPKPGLIARLRLGLGKLFRRKAAQ